MSSFSRKTKHPITGKFENAMWYDDYFGAHHYGVKFPLDNEVYDADVHEWEFEEKL